MFQTTNQIKIHNYCHVRSITSGVLASCFPVLLALCFPTEGHWNPSPPKAQALYGFMDKSVRPPQRGEKRTLLYSVKAGRPPSSSRNGFATFFLPCRSWESLGCRVTMTMLARTSPSCEDIVLHQNQTSVTICIYRYRYKERERGRKKDSIDIDIDICI